MTSLNLFPLERTARRSVPATFAAFVACVVAVQLAHRHEQRKPLSLGLCKGKGTIMWVLQSRAVLLLQVPGKMKIRCVPYSQVKEPNAFDCWTRAFEAL